MLPKYKVQCILKVTRQRTYLEIVYSTVEYTFPLLLCYKNGTFIFLRICWCGNLFSYLFFVCPQGALRSFLFILQKDALLVQVALQFSLRYNCNFCQGTNF
jgi:hypothetical protein